MTERLNKCLSAIWPEGLSSVQGEGGRNIWTLNWRTIPQGDHSKAPLAFPLDIPPAHPVFLLPSRTPILGNPIWPGLAQPSPLPNKIWAWLRLCHAFEPPPPGPPSPRQTVLNFSRCEERPTAHSERRGGCSRGVRQPCTLASSWATAVRLLAGAASSHIPRPSAKNGRTGYRICLQMRRNPNRRFTSPGIGGVGKPMRPLRDRTKREGRKARLSNGVRTSWCRARRHLGRALGADPDLGTAPGDCLWGGLLFSQPLGLPL